MDYSVDGRIAPRLVESYSAQTQRWNRPGSCYSRPRNHGDQFFCDKLDRGLVIRFLVELGFGT